MYFIGSISLHVKWKRYDVGHKFETSKAAARGLIFIVTIIITFIIWMFFGKLYKNFIKYIYNIIRH